MKGSDGKDRLLRPSLTIAPALRTPLSSVDLRGPEQSHQMPYVFFPQAFPHTVVTNEHSDRAGVLLTRHGAVCSAANPSDRKPGSIELANTTLVAHVRRGP